MIGAVVGVQPFGGQGLSGTGPKAGGPLYLRRLATGLAEDNAAPTAETLPGSVGERNIYRTAPRGDVLALPATDAGRARMLKLIEETGNRAVVYRTEEAALAALSDPGRTLGAALVEGLPERVTAIAKIAAQPDGPIVPVHPLDTLDPLLLQHETAISINTTAAGGNASLMTISEGL
jgi:RHH-type proline utilization regulon transcriptional repressor/proline dehydrogenase/delta 1-pyrroline-5-carboxylate dehydrogenase